MRGVGDAADVVENHRSRAFGNIRPPSNPKGAPLFAGSRACMGWMQALGAERPMPCKRGQRRRGPCREQKGRPASAPLALHLARASPTPRSRALIGTWNGPSRPRKKIGGSRPLRSGPERGNGPESPASLRGSRRRLAVHRVYTGQVAPAWGRTVVGNTASGAWRSPSRRTGAAARRRFEFAAWVPLGYAGARCVREVLGCAA